jgi:hypothetical protein
MLELQDIETIAIVLSQAALEAPEPETLTT